MNLIPRKFYLDDIFDDFEPPMPNAMKCDIYEKNGEYHIEVDIPGFKKEDISIDCDNGYLTITASKEYKNDEEGKKYIRRERSFGKFERSFYIGEVDSSKIKAEFKHGMLKITVPEIKEETKQHIEIEG